MDKNGSGVQYPTIDIDGVTYPIKWTRETSYDLSSAGIELGGKSIPFHHIVNALHVLIEYKGTARQLSTFLLGRTTEAWLLINEAAGKVAPPTKMVRAEPAAPDQSPVQ